MCLLLGLFNNALRLWEVRERWAVIPEWQNCMKPATIPSKHAILYRFKYSKKSVCVCVPMEQSEVIQAFHRYQYQLPIQNYTDMLTCWLQLPEVKGEGSLDGPNALIQTILNIPLSLFISK